MINRPLLNPVQTKREYFWLFLIVVLENLIALGIELGNGGVWTSQVRVRRRILKYFLCQHYRVTTTAGTSGWPPSPSLSWPW